MMVERFLFLLPAFAPSALRLDVYKCVFPLFFSSFFFFSSILDNILIQDHFLIFPDHFLAILDHFLIILDNFLTFSESS